MNRFEKAETIAEVVGQAIGAGSMCWEPRPSTQVFDSVEASTIVDDALTRIDELLSCLKPYG